MPYPGIPDEKTGEMESCVEKVMSEGHDKQSAIAICHKSIMGFTIEIVQDPTEINAVLGGSYLPGELLRFENMELAKAEVNRNRDELTASDIDALASTLPLMPLDNDHRQDSVVGLFTAARNDNGSLKTDGIIYARRFPDVAQDVIEGKKLPSIEAHADIALCSLCGGEFARSGDYCDHLRDKHSSGAVRRFKGIRAVGGGVVRNPAGLTAAFDLNSVYMVAAHQDQGGEPEPDPPPPEITAEDSNMKSVEELQAELNEALARVSKLEAKVSDLESGRESLETANADLQAKLDAATEKIGEQEQEMQAMQERNESLVEASRRTMLANFLTNEEFDNQKGVIMAMSDDAIELFASKMKPPKSETPKQPVVNVDPPSDDGLTL